MTSTSRSILKGKCNTASPKGPLPPSAPIYAAQISEWKCNPGNQYTPPSSKAHDCIHNGLQVPNPLHASNPVASPKRVRLASQVCVDAAHPAQPHPRRGTLVQVASMDPSRCTQTLQRWCVAAHIPLRTMTWPLEWVEKQSTFWSPRGRKAESSSLTALTC